MNTEETQNSAMTTYAQAGVDTAEGARAVRAIKETVHSTYRPEVVGDIGGFGGLFAPDLKGYEEPVLVSGTDGVGTKLRIAELTEKFDTVGIDAVAMCVNDIICCGAKPLFFLDYIAIGKNDPLKVASIVKGVANGCKESLCALIGGETAEHPGLMKADDFDIAGFAVGIVDRKKILDPKNVQEGDVIIALPSSGVHSNGFSLVRKVFDIENADLSSYNEELGMSLGEALLTPTALYVKPVLELLKTVNVHSISHITGGGFYENVPRAIPDGLCARIDRNLIKVPKIFELLQRVGNISRRDMYNTFNMGVGMTVIVAKDDVAKALESLKANGVDAYVIGEVLAGEDKIDLC